jgi:hypothetical protein
MMIARAERDDGGGGLAIVSTRVFPQTKVTLFVRRASQQWVVLDQDGNFWILPTGENLWEQRQPFFPSDESELELVPGHYKYMLDLPST